MTQDPISDALTRIRNAQVLKRREVSMPSSKLKLSIVTVLKREGYIIDYHEKDDFPKRQLVIILKYYEGKPVISMLKRVSKPSLRVYKGKNELPKVHNGLGIAIISTSKGVISDHQARYLGEGGEVICYVS
ncbi:30S ribosomal protein S8 [Coxiella endosymbiont of Amblyomma americanum]|uniref:30S ribosomal protein S8 n=1 Tax=Coxiella endosymbiont of Amblyomma americanum TaxID=325775 RepID=UPI00057C86BE|nr:30S ribosomal protein S8 [Coxiella endosymbiont of Amblyomma americanum]AJC50437.1 30S ribosomal protein S8 [Coxiella endosymbiont of Amblyomma americanum]AUJ58777.1 30S ribosomal protein S8 [Coxiella-like endosymbiont of Amblyomma americanum]